MCNMYNKIYIYTYPHETRNTTRAKIMPENVPPACVATEEPAQAEVVFRTRQPFLVDRETPL